MFRKKQKGSRYMKCRRKSRLTKIMPEPFNFYKYMVSISSEKFSRILNMFMIQIRENKYVYL